jgi:hypothetical protein
LQPDGEVDTTIARKKRRLNQEYDSLLDRVAALREEIGLLETRSAGSACSCIAVCSSDRVWLCVRVCVCVYRVGVSDRLSVVDEERRQKQTAMEQLEASLLSVTLDQQRHLLAVVKSVADTAPDVAAIIVTTG